MARRGLHRLGIAFATRRSNRSLVRDKLARGETVYLAGLACPGTHNSGVALIEVSRERGPHHRQQRGRALFRQQAYHRIPAKALHRRDARQRCGGMGRDIGDIAAWLTTWDYPALFGTLARTVLEESPQSFKLLRSTEAAGFRRPPARSNDPHAETSCGRQLGLSERVPLICLPHHDNHAWFSFAASPFADDGEPVAIAVLDGTGDLGSISLYVARQRRDAPAVLQRQHVRLARRLLQRDLLHPGRLDLAVQRRPLYGRRRLGRHGPRQQSAITRA